MSWCRNCDDCRYALQGGGIVTSPTLHVSFADAELPVRVCDRLNPTEWYVVDGEVPPKAEAAYKMEPSPKAKQPPPGKPPLSVAEMAEVAARLARQLTDVHECPLTATGWCPKAGKCEDEDSTICWIAWAVRQPNGKREQ